MNKKFEIEIEEILQKVVKIEANSLKDAINIAKEKGMVYNFNLLWAFPPRREKMRKVFRKVYKERTNP